MDLNLVYDITNYIIRKQRGSFQTYPELDNIFNLGQLDLLSEYNDEYALTGKINNALSPFKKNYQFTLATSVGGLVTLPTDYQYPLMSFTQSYDNATQQTKMGEVRFYNENEWINAVNSQLRAATVKKPAAKIIAGQMELYPKTPNAGIINYIKKPAAPVYSYTQVGRVITYDPNTSTQLEWYDEQIPKVIMKALSYIGINLSEEAITQFAEGKEKQNV